MAESMKRGSINENAVVLALPQKDCVFDIFSCGMFAKKEESYLACSPNGIALLHLNWLQELQSVAGVIEIIGRPFCIATREIMPVIAENTVGSAVRSSTVNLVLCKFGDDKFKKCIPTEHGGQVIQQMIVLNLNVSVCVRASNCTVLYIVIIQSNETLLNDLPVQLRAGAKPVAGCVHQSSTVPQFYLSDDKRKVLHRLPF